MDLRNLKTNKKYFLFDVWYECPNILPWLHLDTHLQNDRIRIFFFFVSGRSSVFKISAVVY